MDKIDAYVFYHSADFDGYLSCVLIACYLKYNNKKFALKSYNYGNPLDIDSLDKTAEVYAVDISFDPEIMLRFKSEFKNFIWMDHHISAIFNSEQHGYADLPGLRTTDHAACVLVWLYFKNLGFDFTENKLHLRLGRRCWNFHFLQGNGCSLFGSVNLIPNRWVWRSVCPSISTWYWKMCGFPLF